MAGARQPLLGVVPGSRLSQSFYGQVATRTMIPNDGTGGAGPYMARTGHYFRAAASGFFFAFPNWWGNVLNESTSGMGSYTNACGFEYPSGTITQCVYSGGATSSTVAAGGTVIGYCPASIPAGAVGWLRARHSSTVNVPWAYGTSVRTNVAIGDAMESTSTDKTLSGTIANTVFGGFFPCAIIALTTASSLAIIGDSRQAGIAEDALDATGDQGELGRAIGGAYAYQNISIPSEHSSDWTSANASRRIALANYCTHWAIAHGINDLRGDNDTTVMASLTAQYALAGARPVYGATLPPVTEGAWSDPAHSDQTISTVISNPYRISVNDWIRLRALYVELADTAENARNGGYWKAPGYTGDGLHELSFGNKQYGSFSLSAGSRVYMPTSPPTLT